MSAYRQLGMAVGHTEVIDETTDEVIARIRGSLYAKPVNANPRDFCHEAATPSTFQWDGASFSEYDG